MPHTVSTLMLLPMTQCADLLVSIKFTTQNSSKQSNPCFSYFVLSEIDKRNLFLLTCS